MANTTFDPLLDSQAFMAMHDYLGREITRAQQALRLQPILMKFSSMANAEMELQQRTRAAKAELAEVEKQVAEIKATVKPAKDFAASEISGAREQAKTFLKNLEIQTEEQSTQITAEMRAKKEELLAITQKIDAFRATVTA